MYRILLIEDDELDQMSFKRYITAEKLPYEYVIVSSISEAQNVLKSEEFDVILTDFTLGDGTALDILDSVKDIPIVLTTGARDEDVAVKAWKAGAYDYLSKDFERKYLKAIPKTIENAIRRRKVEEALDKKQKNLVAIFDAVPIGMFLVDENLYMTRANNAIRQMFHKEYSQLIGRRVGDALGCINHINNEEGCGNTPACPGCSFRKAVQGVLDSDKSIFGLEIRPTLKIDGKEIVPWFRISAKPVIIDNKKCVIVAIDDVTERKKAENDRLLAEEKYRMIFENSAAAITLVDEQERLVSWNTFMEGLLGYEGEELYLMPVKTLYPVGEWEKIRTFDVRQKGMQHHLETRMVKKDGGVIDVDISLSVLKDSDGNTTGSIGIIRDITERKRAEEKLKETMELKSQFISTVSHELRTPLAAMKEGLGIVLDEVVGEINEKQKKFLDIAKRNADRLGALINDVLDFQKLSAGKMNLNIQDSDIAQIVSEVHETMTLYAKKHNVELVSELPENLPMAKFDRAKITQVLTNLISNAIKFTPENGMASVNVRQQNEELVISVHDTGMGIPKEALPKIFERFYRVNRPDKQIQGTGLGLAIVHKIVIMHGGRIDVESEVDQGTTFTVFLPINPKSIPAGISAKNDNILENTVGKNP
ncbi:MAG: PAS domain S-box protein [Sedimentisphaerales bacterium]|nr:PAS domain S-box protein [Sedimentisphaerales bacterium]